MNTAVRVVKLSSQVQSALQWIDVLPIVSWVQLRAVLLVMTVLASAFSIVYIKDLNRRLFIQNQTLDSVRDQIQVDWGKLLLEQGAWSTQSRIQEVAQSKLSMHVPSAGEIVLVKIDQ